MAEESDGEDKEKSSMTALVSSQEGSLSDSLLRLPFPEVDFVGGTNPRLFAKGLKLKIEDDRIVTFTIAEAPFNLNRTKRLKSIHGEICISLHDKMVDNVRCHFLKPEESESMDSLIQQYEDSPAVVAVIFINPSENIQLDDTFITHQGEIVQIPMFSTSLEVGKQIESIASKCEISDVDVKCEFMLKSQHEQSVNATSKNPLLWHLMMYAFPEGQSPVVVSRNEEAFQLLSSAFSNAELKKENKLREAVLWIKDRMSSVFANDFLFYIHLVGHFLEYINQCNRNTQKSILLLADKCVKHFHALRDEDIKDVVLIQSDFQVMTTDGGNEFVFHSLHKQFLQLAQHAYETLKKQENDAYSLQMIARWVIVALKFSLCSQPDCSIDSDQVWIEHLLKVLDNSELTTELVGAIDQCIMYGKMMELREEHSFITPKVMYKVLNRKKSLRKFSELKNALSLHNRVKSSDDYCRIFCKDVLAAHESVYTGQGKVNKKQYKKALTVKGKNSEVLKEGFEYIVCVYKCASSFTEFRESIITALKRWIIFLLQFLNVKKAKHFDTIKGSTNIELLLSDKNLHDHFCEQIQAIFRSTTSHESKDTLPLCTFVQLSKIWPRLLNDKIVADYFTCYHPPPNVKLDSEEEALNEFSNRFPGAANHTFLFVYLLKRIGDQYKIRKEAVQFIMDLVSLNAGMLMSCKFEEDREVQTGFQEHVGSYFQENCNGELILNNFSNLKKKLKLVSSFGEIVLPVLAKMIVTSCHNVHTIEKVWFETITDVVQLLSVFVNAEVIKPTPDSQFYWDIIKHLCHELLQMDWFIESIAKNSPVLAVLFHHRETFVKLQNNLVTSGLATYFDLIIAVTRELETLKSIIEQRQANYEQILKYYKNYKELETVAKSLSSGLMALDRSQVSSQKSAFETCHVTLSELLIKKVTVLNWMSLHDLLSNFRVKLPNHVLEVIHQNVVFPETAYADYQMLPVDVDKHSIKIKKDVTLKMYEKLLADLLKFLEPLKSYMHFLVHFYLNNSLLFQKFIDRHLLSGHDNTTPVQLSDCLKTMRLMFESFLIGDATYKQLNEEFDLQNSDVNVEKELAIMTEFEEFRQYKRKLTIQHLKNMLIIGEVVQNVESLITFCNEFGLTACQESEAISYLKKIINDRKNEKLWQTKKLEDFSRIISQIQKELEVKQLQCLEIFRLLVNNKPLREFLDESNFRAGEGQELERIHQQLALVTQQLQHEEHDTEILNNLHTIVYLLEPLCNPNLSIKELVKIVSDLEISKFSIQLQTVKNNIDLIRMWFSRAEGDTFVNTTAELKSILSNGEFSISVSRLVEIDDDKVKLKFQWQESDVSKVPLSSEEGDSEVVRSTTWNLSQIKDFQRQIGLSRRNEDMKFGKIMKEILRLQKLLESLYHMGHPDYTVFPVPMKCSLETIETEINKFCDHEKCWSENCAKDRETFKGLSFINNAKLIKIHRLLSSSEKNYDEIYRELNFLVTRDSWDLELDHLKGTILRVGLRPTECVGLLMSKFNLQHNLSVLSSSKNYKSTGNIHQLPAASIKELIVYVISICRRFPQSRFSPEETFFVPQSYEILRCHPKTTEAEIMLFLQRIVHFPRNYIVIEVNVLPSLLQEVLLQKYLELHQKMTESCSKVHFIQTSPSIFYGAPHVNEIKLQWADSTKVSITLEEVCDSFAKVELVHGLGGNGKTYYIKQQMKSCTEDCRATVAINEAFSEANVIQKLNSLPADKQCFLHLNFTLLPPGVEVDQEERDKFKSLMKAVAWFLFDLLILGYVEDSQTGDSFGMPRNAKTWKIFVEVPSVTDNPVDNLATFTEQIPLFEFIGEKKLIDDIPYDIHNDSDVQLVCKYLNALNIEKDHPGKGIDKTFSGNRIMFGNEDDLPPEKCQSLLDQYMSDEIKGRKISQQMFIKYMSRRCNFLETCPAYNFNEGVGSGNANTTKLGSTLMKAMLREVQQYCTKESWSTLTHQLIYEQQGGGGSIGLITLNPLPDEEEGLKKLNLEVPSKDELCTREVLDMYLARGLSLPLQAVTELVYDENMKPRTQYKTLQLIDDENYILTLDYTLKMLNIHERRECGVPVIIEGETGVGKTELLKILSKLWNYAWVVQWSEIKRKFQSILRDIQDRRKLNRDVSLNKQMKDLQIAINREADDVWIIKEELLKLRGKPILTILQPKYNVEEFWQLVRSFEKHTDLGVEKLVKLFLCILTADVSTFYKLDVHAGLKPSDIIHFFNDQVVHQANSIKQYFSSHVPRVTVYLDEINTSSCMGLFKEIVVDNSIDGMPLPDNIFIVAACNPLRGNSLATLRNLKKIWLKPTYCVHKLHPTLEYLKWDYGALNNDQEQEYVIAKMKALSDDISCFKAEDLSFLITESQNRIRLYAYETLQLEVSQIEAEIYSRSSVSQRDMQRVFNFYQWILNNYKKFELYDDIEQKQIRAVLVSLGLVYYLRLGNENRKDYADFLNKKCHDFGYTRFTTAFDEELEWYAERLHVPVGIAKTRALKENLFANIACCQTKTPLIIIGEPGTSKTLSFNLISNNFKGKSSKQKSFQSTDRFKGLQPYFYQCSRHTTSNEIENVFNRAIARQHTYQKSDVPTHCIVFMDEAGLPEERHESLKVLHYHLDNPKVSFVAITNYALDAAKTNRAVCLYRPETSTQDLKVLADELLKGKLQEPETKLISGCCAAFSNVLINKEFKNFYGQRDFMHFLNYLRQKRGRGFLNEEIVLEALECNFNGHKSFPVLCDQILTEMNSSYDETNHRTVLEILRTRLNEGGDKVSRLLEGTAARYKLIIDGSEDDSAVRVLFTHGILDRDNTNMFVCSEFTEERHMHTNTIAGICHSAERGNTVIMFQTEEIHESFYELFNQRFRYLDIPEKGLRFFTNISIGAHTKLCRVDPNFQCVVVVKKSVVESVPPAFLNRFEKFSIEYHTLLGDLLYKLPPNLHRMLWSVCQKVSTLVNKLHGSKSFYGYSYSLMNELDRKECQMDETDLVDSNETLCSLLVSLLPPIDYHYQIGCEVEDCVPNDIEDKKLKLLITIVKALRTKACLNIPKILMEEVEKDCQVIFEILTKDEEFTTEIESEQFCIEGAVGEALDALHSPTGDTVGMHEDSCLVIAVMVQWLVRYVTKRCMQLLTPEALAINAKYLPQTFVKDYFQFQEHFSLKDLIKNHYQMLSNNEWDRRVCGNKLLCYTRDAHVFHSFPSVYPSSATTNENENTLRTLVLDDVSKLKLLKLSRHLLEEELEENIAQFLENQDHTVFVFDANMHHVTLRMINHIRILLEQQENATISREKLFVILLHFPPSLMFNYCYPVLFLNGWDHFYLDCVTTSVYGQCAPNSSHLVDIKCCFKTCLGIQSPEDAVTMQLPLLDEAVSVISSRIVVACIPGMNYNVPMKISRRQDVLRQILHDTRVGKSLCMLFSKYWSEDAIRKFLMDASQFAFNQLSTLSITSYVQTRIKALFFEFLVYMLHKLNEDCNMDILFDNCICIANNGDYRINAAVEQVFSAVIASSKLPNFSFFNQTQNIFPPPHKSGYSFPFFTIMYHLLEDLVDAAQQVVKGHRNSGNLEKQLYEAMKGELKTAMEPTDARSMVLTALVQSVHNQELWHKYLTDFIKIKFLPDVVRNDSGSESFKEKMITAYFDFEHHIESHCPESLLSWVHVHSEVHKLDLASTIDRIQKLKPFVSSQPEDTLASATQNLVSIRAEHLGEIVIEISYESLKCILRDVRKGEKPVSDMRSWYIVYRDIVQVPTLYESMRRVEKKSLFFKIHVMFLLLHCCDSLTDEVFEEAISFYSNNLNQISTKSYSVQDVVNCVCTLRKHNKDSFLSSFVQNMLHFVLQHPIDTQICEWFIQVVDSVPPQTFQLLDYITPSLYKDYLLHILGIHDGTKDENDLLELFQPMVRTLIGKELTVLSDGKIANENVVRLFVPDSSSLPKLAKSSLPKLAKFYVQVVFERLSTDEQNLPVLFNKLNKFADQLEKCTDSLQYNLLILEKEAYMQRSLYVLGSSLAEASTSHAVVLGNIHKRMNQLLEKEGFHQERGLVLCMNVWKKSRSRDKFEKTLRNNEAFICLTPYKDRVTRSGGTVQVEQISLPQLFRHELKTMYENVCEIMKKINSGKRKPEDLKKLADTCHSKINVDFETGSKFEMEKKKALQMCIWLNAYYNFYEKEESPTLAEAVANHLEEFFPTEVMEIILCFLDPNRVRKRPEKDIPADPNAHVFNITASLHVRPAQHHGKKVDPIYELFFPSTTKDVYDRQICNALASIVAVTLACPVKSTHLWYHLFSCDELYGTFVTGFLFDSEIKDGRLYDCGVELNELGNYGRPDYLKRAENGILNLQSLYLLLWSNFGAFCLHLLTQRNATLKGTVISDYQPVRHYCLKQMKLMWLHISVNLGLTPEQQSLLVVRAMQRMIQVCCQNPVHGLLESSERRDDYEKMWHQIIFVPSLYEVQHELPRLKQSPNPLIKDLEKLNKCYPCVPSLQTFTHYVLERCEGSSSKYEILVKFLHRYNRLKAAGTLLPQLIKFYLWLHTYLSHLITQAESTEMSVYTAIEVINENYPLQIVDTELFDTVAMCYNKYIEEIGGSIGAGACANIRRQNDMPRLTKETPIFRLLPGVTSHQQEEERDFLFLVIDDIAHFHNEFLKEVLACTQSTHVTLQKHMSDELSSIHPAAIDKHSCIVGENSRDLIRIISSHQTKDQGFDLLKIQEDIVISYFSGKSLIASCSDKLHKTFQYKVEEKPESHTIRHPTDLILMLDIAKQLDDDFKEPVSKEDEFLTALQYEMYSVDYDTLLNVAVGLKAIAEHVKQETQDGSVKHLQKTDIIGKTVREVLPKLLHGDQSHRIHDAFKEFGMQRLTARQCTIVGDVPMTKLFTTLEQVVVWIKDGVYDFHTLPKKMKRQLMEENVQKILGLPESYEGTSHELLKVLKVIVDALAHSEQDIITNVDKIAENDVFEYLKSNLLIGDYEDKVITYFPDRLCLGNYMSLRICLRRVITKLEEQVDVTNEDKTSRWYEYVDDLWVSDSKLKHLRVNSTHLSYGEVFNPITGLYGFQLHPDSPEESVSSDSPISIQHKEESQDIANETQGDKHMLVCQLTPNDVADFLRSLKLDQYVETFLENDVDGEMMNEIINENSNNTLEALDVQKKHRLKIKLKFKPWAEKRVANINIKNN